ncbi:Transcriptional regulator SlyA [compost metagenome]
MASVLELGKAALGGLLDRLELSGLIERRADGNDRRAKRIYLTHQGHLTVKEMHQLSHEMSERVLDGLSQDQRLLLAGMFALLKSNLLSIKTRARYGQHLMRQLERGHSLLTHVLL